MRAAFGTSARRNITLLVMMLISLLVVAGCAKEEAAVRPAPPVTVGQPTMGLVREFAIFTGFSRAVESADVVARVPGTLETVEFSPSSPVKKGDLLFTIEKTKYRALRDAARAAVQSAEADLLRAETELKRVEKAGRSKAVSEMDVDRARADRDMALAAVSSAEASLDDAALNFSYTDVVSPIDGVVSRRLVDAGNLVGQDGSTKLTRVNKLQPIHVYFNAPESLVLRYLEGKSKNVTREVDGDDHGLAQVALANDVGYPHAGRVDFIDNEVNVNTGTIELRAELANEDLALFPGLFVRVKMTGREIPDAVQIPAVAVGTDLGGKYVLAVGEGDIVEQMYVQLGEPQEDGLVHVKEGLEGNETIIVNGMVYARPGLPVTPLTPEQFQAMQAQAAQK